MKKHTFILLTAISILCYSLMSCSSENNQEIYQMIKRADISKDVGVDGIAVGEGAAEGTCYRLGKQLVASYSLNELEVLIESNDPTIRCVGMICLAYDIEQYKDIILSHGTAEQSISYVPYGCLVEDITVEEFAKLLVNDEFTRICYTGEISDLEKYSSKNDN